MHARLTTLAGLLTFGIGAAHADYVIDTSVQTTDDVNYGALGDAGIVQRTLDCSSAISGSLVRGWFLVERNQADFRASYHFCREMDVDGTLMSGPVRQTHFDHGVSGTVGSSQIPLDTLPVGVRTKWYNDPFSPYDKLIDVNLLYNEAEDIVAFDNSWSGAGYALGQAGDTLTLVCPAGMVMNGIRVLEKTNNTGGSNQSEIVGVRIECSDLDEV